MGRIGYTISFVDDLNDSFFVESETAGDAMVEAARAIEDLGATQILITRQGDEDD